MYRKLSRCITTVAISTIAFLLPISTATASPVTGLDISPVGYNIVNGKQDMANPLSGDNLTTDPGFSSTQPSQGNVDELERIIGTDDRTQIKDTTIAPYRWVGTLDIVTPDGTEYFCTGTLISPDSVITAGHCLHDEVTSIVFTPGRNGETSRYPSAKATQIWHDKNSRQNDRDYGLVKLDKAVGNQVGWFGIKSVDNERLNGKGVTVIGYPADKEYNTMWKHRGTVFDETQRELFYNTDTAPGQSGASIVDDNGTIYGIHLAGRGERNRGDRLTGEVFNVLVNLAFDDQAPNPDPNPAPGDNNNNGGNNGNDDNDDDDDDDDDDD